MMRGTFENTSPTKTPSPPPVADTTTTTTVAGGDNNNIFEITLPVVAAVEAVIEVVADTVATTTPEPEKKKVVTAAQKRRVSRPPTNNVPEANQRGELAIDMRPETFLPSTPLWQRSQSTTINPCLTKKLSDFDESLSQSSLAKDLFGDDSDLESDSDESVEKKKRKSDEDYDNSGADDDDEDSAAGDVDEENEEEKPSDHPQESETASAVTATSPASSNPMTDNGVTRSSTVTVISEKDQTRQGGKWFCFEIELLLLEGDTVYNTNPTHATKPQVYDKFKAALVACAKKWVLATEIVSSSNKVWLRARISLKRRHTETGFITAFFRGWKHIKARSCHYKHKNAFAALYTWQCSPGARLLRVEYDSIVAFSSVPASASTPHTVNWAQGWLVAPASPRRAIISFVQGDPHFIGPDTEEIAFVPRKARQRQTGKPVVLIPLDDENESTIPQVTATATASEVTMEERPLEPASSSSVSPVTREETPKIGMNLQLVRFGEIFCRRPIFV